MSKMRSLKKDIIINAPLEIVFARMDDLSKTGMHMSNSSMMMMGSKLMLEQLPGPSQGLGASFHWSGSVMGMPIDITETVTKWVVNKEKIWETIGTPKIIILGWYRMILKTEAVKEGTEASLQIDYTKPRGAFRIILYYLLSHWYCNWCLNNMLNDTKIHFDKST